MLTNPQILINQEILKNPTNRHWLQLLVKAAQIDGMQNALINVPCPFTVYPRGFGHLIEIQDALDREYEIHHKIKREIDKMKKEVQSM